MVNIKEESEDVLTNKNNLIKESILALIKSDNLPFISPEQKDAIYKWVNEQKIENIFDFNHIRGAIITDHGIDIGKFIDASNFLAKQNIKNIIKKSEEVEQEKKTNPLIAFQIFTYQIQAEVFQKQQPVFYDRAGIWWMWNFEDNCWALTDEIDILNLIQQATGVDVVTPSYRAKVLNILKQSGRKQNPIKQLKSWILFKDKIVDVCTGKIISPSPEYFITNPIPWKIGDSEETPTIDKLFKEWVVKEGVQDESYVQTLYEIVAYCVLKDQFLQRIFALTGSGSNGKGTFQKLIEKFVGAENTCSSEMKLLSANRFETSALYRKQVCFMGEIDAYDMKNTNQIKQLTGEDPIRYEFKGKTPFSERSYTTCLVATNSLPITPDKSKGFYRRWLIVDFPNEFPVGKDVIGEIPDVEFNNLARKIIGICKKLYNERKFTNEGNIETRSERYEDRSNPLLKFIETCCKETPDGFIELRELYGEYNNYLKAHRLRSITIRTLGKALRNEGFSTGSRKIPMSGETKSTTCVFGITIKNTIKTIETNEE